MHPVISLELAGHIIRIGSYQFFAGIAALLGSITTVFMLRRVQVTFRQALLLIVISACSFLIGARLWNYAVNYRAYDESFHIWTLRFAGFSVYGGILGAAAALIPYSRLIKTNTFELLDALVLPAGLAFATTRIGCYLNGCCSGKATHSFLGVYFPQKSGLTGFLGDTLPLIGSTHLPVYPTQLFEMSLALIGLIFPLWLTLQKRKQIPAGTCFLVYFIWACAMRWLVLPFRELSYPAFVVNSAYPLIYATMIISASILLAYKIKAKH